MSIEREDLLAAIRADPASDAPYLVYADWLQARGEPHGELIAVQHAIDAARRAGGRPPAELVARDRALRAAIGLPERVGRIKRKQVWSRGFVIGMHFEVELRRVPHVRIAHFMRQSLAHGVVSLASSIGMMVHAEARDDVASLVAALASRPELPLRSIDVVVSEMRALERVGVARIDASELIRGRRELRSLWLEGETLVLGDAVGELGELRSLSLTGRLDAADAARVLEAEWPELELLRLELGAHDHAALGPWLDGRRARKLTRLTLSGAHGAARLLEQLADSPLLERLRVLSFRGSDLTPAAVPALLARRDRFTHLEELDLYRSRLGDDRRLEGLAKHVFFGAQWGCDQDDDDQ